MLRRVTTWIVTAAMLLTVLPVLGVPAQAKLNSIASEYTYKIRVKNSGVKRGGTDNDFYCAIETVEGQTQYIKMNSGADDFEKNDDRTYSFNLKLQPWQIKRVGLAHKSGIDAVHIAWFKFYLPDGTEIHQDVDKWFNKYEKLYGIAGSTDRYVTDCGNFYDDFSGTVYYAPDVTSGQSDINLFWNGQVKDRYFENSYNIFDYPGAVGLTFSSAGTTYNGLSSLNRFTVLTDNGLAKVRNNSLGFDDGITLYTNALLAFMKKNKIYSFTLNSMIDYEYDYDEKSYDKTSFRLIRTGFDLGDASAVSRAYTPVRDNNFYTTASEYNRLEIRIPVISYEHYYAPTIAKTLAANINNGTTTAKIYYGETGTEDYITVSSGAYYSGGNVYLTCSAPADYANEDGCGITVVLENAAAEYNGRTHTLDRTGAKYSSYISTHKVDTKGFEQTVLTKDGEALDLSTGFDFYAASHSFKLDIPEAAVNGDIYVQNNDGTRTAGMFSYQLYETDGTTVKALKNYKTNPTTKVPYASNAEYTIVPKDKAEGTYLLKITSRDLANNVTATQLPVMLDTVAPRSSFTVSERALANGAKRGEYTFAITDATGTGRLYYTFVRDGYAVPDASQVKPETSGPEDTVFEKWGFIDQMGGAGTTVVLEVPDGDFFNGTLYWYTVDAAGNDSRDEKAAGTDAQGRNYTKISINNVKSDCEIIVDDVTPGRPAYNIAFETNSHNTVDYRWISKNLYTTRLTRYTSGQNPGESRQYLDGSSTAVLLNGEYTLEYTVTTPDGSRTTYTRDFFFDNTNPMISFKSADSVISDTERMTVNVKDLTNIETLTYQLIDARGNAVGEVTALPAGLPVVDAEILLAPGATGVYQIRVTAVDVNGQTSVSDSKTFSIRTAAPEITFEGIMVETEYDGVPITGGDDITVCWRVDEHIENADYFDAKQSLFYRFSTDGINYSAWQTWPAWGTSMDDDGLHAEIEVYAPIALNEGMNQIFMQAAFASSDTVPDTIRPEFIAVNEEACVILDTRAPQYRLNMEQPDLTNKSVTGTLIVSDDYASPEEITCMLDAYTMVNLTEGEITASSKTVNVEVLSNLSVNIIVSDAVGNSVSVPIEVICIDKDVPYVENVYGTAVESGLRQDHDISFDILEALDDLTGFAVIEGKIVDNSEYSPDNTGAPQFTVESVDPNTIADDLFGPLPENIKIVDQSVTAAYPDGTVDMNFNLFAYGDEEILPAGEKPDPDTDAAAYLAWMAEWEALNKKGYILAAKVEDAAGNTAKQTIGSMILINATAEIEGAYCVPAFAYDRAAIMLKTTVPVYVLPGDKVPSDMASLSLSDGRLDTSTDDTLVAFTEYITKYAASYSTDTMLIIDSLGDTPVYFADEAGRVYRKTIHVKDLSEYDEEAADDPYTVYVHFGSEAPVDVKLYYSSTYTTDMSQWIPTTAEELEVYDPYDGVHSYVYVVLEARSEDGKTAVMYGAEVSESGYRYTEGYMSEPDFSRVYSLCEGNDTDGYTRLVYEVNDTANTNKIITCLVDVSYASGDTTVTDTVGSVFELIVLDTTSPDVDVRYSAEGPTNQPVTVYISASDFELSTNRDAEDTSAETDLPILEQTPAEAAADVGIKSIAVTDFMEEDPDYTVDDLSLLSYNDLGQIAETSVVFEKNGYVVVRVTNLRGLETYKVIDVQWIVKEEITEGEDYDYVVGYYTEDAEGNLQPIDPDAYYKEVIAQIDLTSNGVSKEIEAVNNLGSLCKTLTAADDTFTFRLRDRWGNVKDVTVSHDKFDTAAPSVRTELSVTETTNQPYPVLVYVTDLQSAPGTVTVTDPYGMEVSVETFDTSTDESGAVTAKHSFKASMSGTYRITAGDIHGNTVTSAVYVNNIDTTAPTVVSKMLTTDQLTRQNVGVKLYFSKPNVTLTRVEPSTSMSANDISVDYANAVIRFFENGYVSIWFVDAYGNEGTDVVNVENICRTAPSLTAVQTLADDQLSVSVRFIANDDETRDLSKLYVIHNGITPMRTVTDADGNILSEEVLNASEVEFVLVDNGTYTFRAYDSVGNICDIPVTVTGIDRTAPIITDVSWSYSYTDENGELQTVTHSITPGDEFGYNAVEDETYHGTNQDITASVTTDAATKFVGAYSDEYKTVHSITYDRDGWFNFDMVKPNGLMDRYGLGLYLIDKTAPVIEGVEDMIFFENPRAGTPYDRALLTYRAYDVRYDEVTDLTDKVEIDWGGFNPDDITDNVFDRSKPYTVTYTVRDNVGNETVVRRTITLVGLFDTMIRVNGGYTDNTGMIEVDGDTVALTLDNFAGKAYARYEKGIHTMGQMKSIGTVIEPASDGSFTLKGLSEGWYTFYVQTDLRDYFCVRVYVYGM